MEGEVIDEIGKILKKSDYFLIENLVWCCYDILERFSLFEMDFCVIFLKLCWLEIMFK